jgi:hypothetical protein
MLGRQIDWSGGKWGDDRGCVGVDTFQDVAAFLCRPPMIASLAKLSIIDEIDGFDTKKNGHTRPQ